ncbi:MAG TPA: MmcQ/YjbR family DNA-binding protein [Mycobacteriales bacterium]
MSARDIALSLPGATEAPHHDRVSYRISGKIFATVPDPEHLNVMLDPDAIEAAVAENPGVCEPVYWGKRLSAVRVDVAAAGDAVVTELLTDAYRRRT